MTRMLLALLLAPGLAGCANLAQTAQPSMPATATIERAVPPGMQWLYGSGESAASSIQAYHALRDHVLAAAATRPARSVVLSAGATLGRPDYVSCGRKPLAVILDVDETVIQNLGYEYDEALTGRGFDSAIWGRWERTGADKVLPVPGAVTALQAIRRVGVAVIFNSNRNAASADQTEAAIVGAGLGPAKHGETLFLSGDDATGSAKDGRRARIAARHCVVAMAGDQLGDFSDLFNARTLTVAERRRLAGSGATAAMWGSGWFMLSNPVYGPGLRGGFDDVFPADRRWTDPRRAN